MRIVAVAAVFICLSGCAWTPKPYADDPLVRTRTALPGDPFNLAPVEAPEPPQPPEPPEWPQPPAPVELPKLGVGDHVAGT